MKPPEPEALGAETTSETEAELDRAMTDFFSSVEHSEAVDWRQFPAEEEEESEEEESEEPVTFAERPASLSEGESWGAAITPQPGRPVGTRPRRTPEESRAAREALAADLRARVMDDGS